MVLGHGISPVLVIFSGLPGTGKSTFAEHVASWLHAPVFSKDELEAALWRSGIDRAANSGWAGYELLTTLARAQLQRRQSAILDSVATVERIRAVWRSLAAELDTRLRVVETVCSDEVSHRARLATRRRAIPGWPELSWEEVVEVGARYEPWCDARLILDASRPLDQNLRALHSYILEGQELRANAGQS